MNITLKQAEEYLEELRPFVSGNLTAQWEGTGEPGSFAEQYYVVRSYGTRIAWARRADWGINANIDHDAYHHSSTTSKQANVVKNSWLARGLKVWVRDTAAGELIELTA